MAKDTLIDIRERDIVIGDKSNQSEPCFNVEWDEKKCKIKVPYAYSSYAKYDANGIYSCRVFIPYMPLDGRFLFELLVNDGNVYGVTDITGGKAYTKPYDSLKPIEVKASQLPIIDIDGMFRVVFTRGSDKVMIFSAKESDLAVGTSDNQSAQLLAICAPCKNYRYPTTGIDITKYLHSIVPYTDLNKKIDEQYKSDGKNIHSADFDNHTGDLVTIFSKEEGKEEDGKLTPVDKLKTDWLSQFTDANIRTLIDVEKRDLFGFQTIFNYDGEYVGLIIFPSDDLIWSRPVTKQEEGNYNSEGEIQSDDEYYVVEAEFKAGSIIAFNTKNVDLRDESYFFLNELNITDEYLPLCTRPNEDEYDYINCALITKDCTIKYSIKRSAYDQGDGIYLLQEKNDNIVNMMLIAKDNISGRNKGIVSNKIAIDDETLDEIVENYGTKDAVYNEVLLDFEEMTNIFNVVAVEGAKLYRLDDSITQNKSFSPNGIQTTRAGYYIVRAALQEESLIQFNLPDNYDIPVIFVLFDTGGKIYTDPVYIKEHRWGCDECKTAAIVLKKCTIQYAIKASDYNAGYGVYLAEPELDSLRDYLVTSVNPITGKVTGRVSIESKIKDVFVDRVTGQVSITRA